MGSALLAVGVAILFYVSLATARTPITRNEPDFLKLLHKPGHESCLSPAQLAAASGLKLSLSDRQLLSSLCITEKFVQLQQLQTNGTAFLDPVINDAIPPNVTCEETLWCDRANICSRVCKRGSVVVDDWLKSAVDFQWKLARRQPFCYAQVPGSHNSGISSADGYGNRDVFFQAYLDALAFITHGGLLTTNNQWLSLTDQLNLGVRNIELDTHWAAGALRVAHCGGLHVQQLNQIVRTLNLVARLLGHPIRWDTETMGCQPSLSSIPAADQRTVEDAMQEIAAWMALPGNEEEFVVLFFDDQRDLLTWNKVGLLLEQVRGVFGEAAVVTPADWRGVLQRQWPSIDGLVRLGKKVLLVSGTDYGEQMAPLMFTKGPDLCGWFEPHLRDFVGPEQCAFEERRMRPTGSGTLSRVLSCELTYGPLNCAFIYGDDGLVLDRNSLPGVSACTVNMPAPDRLTPLRTSTQIWSWAPGHPLPAATGLPAADACAAVHTLDGRWRVTPCATPHTPTACRLSNTLPMPFPSSDQIAALLSTHAGSRSQLQGRKQAVGAEGGDGIVLPWVLATGEYGVCPEGYEFEVPQTGRENVALVSMMKVVGVQAAWLPLRGPAFEPESWQGGVRRGTPQRVRTHSRHHQHQHQHQHAEQQQQQQQQQPQR